MCGEFEPFLVAKKLPRVRYYWSTIEKDWINYTKNCIKCQSHGNMIHSPAKEIINGKPKE